MTNHARLLQYLPHLVILTVTLVGGFLRFYNLNWDQGHYLHPDERLYVNSSNISLPQTLDEFFSPHSSLNPNMFYYGTFPLFLYKLIHWYIIPNISFLITSRLISALFSTFTIPIIYLIGKNIFSQKIGLYASIVFAFATGSIQHAHFNTTESMLVFFLSCITYLSSKLITDSKYLFFIPISILLGFSYGTKITGLTFAIIPFISFCILFFTKKRLKDLFVISFFSVVISLVTGFISAPYNAIDYSQFKAEQTYMQGVIYGDYKPPFTIIYEGTLPYLYQLLRVLPFTFGFVSLPLSLVGFFLLIKRFRQQKVFHWGYLFLLIFPLLYFLWSGMWYAKFTRYYLLLLPFFSIWAGITLAQMKKELTYCLLALIVVNGIISIRLYTTTHTRLQASEWIYENIQNNSRITGEHWDDNLPLPMPQQSVFRQQQLPVYDVESSQKLENLAMTLSTSDYFIISSRRVYYSIMRNKNMYPATNIFYEKLFSDKLGYSLEKSFTNYPFFFSDDFADESFQSYDHPPVYIFKNIKKLSHQQIKQLLSNKN